MPAGNRVPGVGGACEKPPLAVAFAWVSQLLMPNTPRKNGCQLRFEVTLTPTAVLGRVPAPTYPSRFPLLSTYCGPFGAPKVTGAAPLMASELTIASWTLASVPLVWAA